VLVAGSLWLLLVLTHDWPIGDGGLFYSMIGDVLDASFALPWTGSYQGDVIPFAYPPLGFYMAAGLEAATPLSRVDIMRFLPVASIVLCLPAMYLVARESVTSHAVALVATAYFGILLGLTPHLISGGGLTRSTGLLLGLLAVWQGLRMYRTGSWTTAATTALLAGFALLAHPEMGPFIGVALGAALLTHLDRRSVLLTVMAAAGAAMLIAPWLLTVVSRHGFEPFLSAIDDVRRSPFEAVVAYGFLFLLLVPVVGILDLLGQVHESVHRRPRLILWRAGAFLFDLRHSPVSAAPPTSLLAGLATVDLVIPFVGRLAARLRARALTPQEGRRLAAIVSLTLLTLASLPALSAGLGAIAPGSSLTFEQREAMAWVNRHTAPSTRVVVLASRQWGSDFVSEWFPALSGRTSLTTSQGYEWVRSVRLAQGQREAELRACRGFSEVAGCVDVWIKRHAGTSPVIVYIDVPVGMGCCDPVAQDLMQTGYREVWRMGGSLLLVPALPFAPEDATGWAAQRLRRPPGGHSSAGVSSADGASHPRGGR
jgi:hypothetical protein